MGHEHTIEQNNDVPDAVQPCRHGYDDPVQDCGMCKRPYREDDLGDLDDAAFDDDSKAFELRCMRCDGIPILAGTGHCRSCLNLPVPAGQPMNADTARACCCLGIIDNTHYKCLSAALDLDHCTPTSTCYAECMRRLAGSSRAFRRTAGITRDNTPAATPAVADQAVPDQDGGQYTIRPVGTLNQALPCGCIPYEHTTFGPCNPPQPS